MYWVKIFDSEKEALTILLINSVRKMTLNGKDYCLIRNSEGIFAISDSCSHDRASLSQGKCNANGRIECPWHHYLFDPSSGKCINHNCTSLETFPVKICEEGVFFAP
jgi:nitrite reductase/ring-hydroxylating ferredoxin subunit